MEKLSAGNSVAARFSSGLGILYLLFCANLLIFYIFKKTAAAFLWKILCIVWDVLVGILCCCCKKSKNEEVAEEEARLKEMADQGIDS